LHDLKAGPAVRVPAHVGGILPIDGARAGIVGIGRQHVVFHQLTKVFASFFKKKCLFFFEKKNQKTSVHFSSS
jgi:hypothetical protein